MKQRTLSQLKKDLTKVTPRPNDINKGKKSSKMPVSANNVTRAIIDYITLSGGFATRINTQGQYDPRLKIWRPGSTVRGMSDILAVIDGHAIFIEVKVGKDRQSKEQKEFEKMVTKPGGYYLIVDSLDSFIEQEIKIYLPWVC